MRMTVLVASSEEELQELVSRVYGAAREDRSYEGLRERTTYEYTVNGNTISEVSSLKYLGAMFNAEALCDEEIKDQTRSGT